MRQKMSSTVVFSLVMSYIVFALAAFGYSSIDGTDTSRAASYGVFWPIWLVVLLVKLAIYTVRAVWSEIKEAVE